MVVFARYLGRDMSVFTVNHINIEFAQKTKKSFKWDSKQQKILVRPLFSVLSGHLLDTPLVLGLYRARHSYCPPIIVKGANLNAAPCM